MCLLWEAEKRRTGGKEEKRILATSQPLQYSPLNTIFTFNISHKHFQCQEYNEIRFSNSTSSETAKGRVNRWREKKHHIPNLATIIYLFLAFNIDFKASHCQ